MTTLSPPERAARTARRWLWHAGIAMAINVALYLAWQPGWDVLHDLAFAWTLASLTIWYHHRGFVRGWNAATEERP